MTSKGKVSNKLDSVQQSKSSGRVLTSHFALPFQRPTANTIITILAAGMFFFLTTPLLALLWRAFGDLSGIKALVNSSILNAIILSLSTTTLSLLLILILGTPLAYSLAHYRFPLKRLVNLLIELPIVLPPVVAGLSLLMAFGRRGLFGPWLEQLGVSLPFTTAAVVVAQTFVAAPFFIRAAQLRFKAIPSELLEAAEMDGAPAGTIFWYIALPLARPGLLAGLLLSWARALGEFGATILFAGSLQGRTQTMPLLVYGALERNLNEALWSSILLIALALFALLLVRHLTRHVEEAFQL